MLTVESYSTSSEYSLWKQSTSPRSGLWFWTSGVGRLQLVAAGRLRWLPLFGIRQKTSSAIISTFVSNINSTSPRPSTPIQSMQCFYIANAGEGGIIFQLSGCTRCPPSPAPHPPKAQIFTNRLRSHCCGNLRSQISRLSNCKATAQLCPVCSPLRDWDFDRNRDSPTIDLRPRHSLLKADASSKMVTVKSTHFWRLAGCLAGGLLLLLGAAYMLRRRPILLHAFADTGCACG